MTLFDFAMKNIVRDKGKYIYYFVNCLFSVMVFFLFSVLSFHPSLSVISGGSTMAIILAVGELVSVGFSIAFIGYSIMGFLKSRSKQFGVITLSGASKKQLNQLIFWENIILGLLAVVTGIVLGLLVAKAFLDLAGLVIGDVDFYFYFPVRAILLTIVVMGGLFFCIALITPRFIRKEKIIHLVKAEEKGEKAQRLFVVSIIFGLTAVITVWAFFSKQKSAAWFVDSQMILLSLAIAVIMGIYLMISVITQWIEQYEKKNGFYYHGVEMLFLSDFRNRKKANCIGMTMTALLYALSFLAMTVLLSQNGNVRQDTDETFPIAVQYTLWDKNADWTEDIAYLRSELEKEKGYREQEVMLYALKNDTDRTGVMKNSDYNDMMKLLNRDSVEVKPGNIYYVEGEAGDMAIGSKRISNYEMLPQNIRNLFEQKDLRVSLCGENQHLILLSGFTSSVIVVSDEDFNKISDELERRYIYAFDYADKYKDGDIVQAITEHFSDAVAEGTCGIACSYEYYETSKIQTALTLYIGAILSFAFMIAVASFLFSRLYASLEADCCKYQGVVRIGLSKKELSKILSKSVALQLFVPFFIALLVMWAGVMALESHVIISNIPSAGVYTILLIGIEIVFYLFVQKQYKKKIFEKVFERSE